MMRTYFIVIFIIITALYGCANRYGYLIKQTIVKVETIPPFLPYYIVEREDAIKYFGTESADIKIGDDIELDYFISLQVRDISNSSGFTYTVGSYVLIIDCGKIYRTRLIEITNKENILPTVSCLTRN